MSTYDDLRAINGRRLEISARPPELGGGWRLQLIEDGEEVGGGVFPSSPNDPDDVESHAEALATGLSWVKQEAGRGHRTECSADQLGSEYD